jgi:cellulose synthase/poly-beta-1,6-N-acetylglucosamine synthase-like glycosyltransferase
MNTLLQVLYVLFVILQVIVLFYLLQPTLLLLVYAIKKALGMKRPEIKADAAQTASRSFAAIITAHKSLALVPPLVDSLLKQHYDNFTIYIVADACEDDPLTYDHPRVKLLRPATRLNAKIRSIDYAINHFAQPHDVLVIFDSDNLAHPDYLSVLNHYFNQGHRAVQTNLQPKNTDTLYARLDAAGNLYNNFSDRLMRSELGLSSNIWGLGIAMETSLYREIIYQHFLGGFDKKIQADIVKKIPLLAYAPEAMVYDEKIDNGAALEKQRTRWINAYFKYFRYGWDVFATGLRRGSFNLVYFGVNLLRPPLFILLAAAFFLGAVNIFVSPAMAGFWLGVVAVFVASFFLIVLVMQQEKKIFTSLFYMPFFVLRQVKALLKIKAANKSFLQTDNNKVLYIEDVLKKQPLPKI